MLPEVIMFFISLFWQAPVPSGPGWRADNTVTVSFVADPNAVCGPAIPGSRIMACADKVGGSHLVLPNPCIYREYDAYARLACHELGHTNGWKHEYR